MLINLFKNSDILFKDFFKIKEKTFDSKKHILAWADWLLKSQEVNNNWWYSVKYSLVKWWDLSYPETTWYIIPTLYEVYKFSNDKKYYDSILKAWEYLLNIQMKDWSWWDSVKWEPAIFDIWQIIFGLLKLYEITNDDKYLKSAIKWWDFIISNQEKNGSWVKYAFNNQPHTYYSRVSWALLKLWQATNDEKYKDSAIKQLNWVLDELDENYFSSKMSFFNDWNSVLHTIVYTARWLYESWKILDEEKYINAWKWIVDKLLEIYKNWKNLYSNFYKNWNTTFKFYCLTWLAQLSILWQNLYQDTKEKDYLFYAIKLNHFLKQTQNITTKNENIKWWIKWSYPIWWKYMIWAYPNWAVKFFVDALLLEEKIKKEEWINEKDFSVKERFNQEVKKFPENINNNDFRIKEIDKIIRKWNNFKLLDLWCAKWRYSKYFAEKWYKVFWIDPAELFIDYAKENNNHTNILEYKVWWATSIPYKDKYFDILVVIEVLQHVKDINKALKEIKRVLKDDWQLILIDRNPISIIWILKPILEKMWKWMYKKDDVFKEKWYLSWRWRNILKEVWFENIEIKTIQRKWYSLDRFYMINN